MREEKYARHWKILTFILDHQKGKRIDEIAKQAECSQRTVRRDLTMLQEAGFPIFNQQETRGTVWKLLDSFKNIPPVPFTAMDALTLLLARNFMGDANHPLHQRLNDILERLKAKRSPEFCKSLDQLEKSVHFIPSTKSDGRVVSNPHKNIPGGYDDIIQAVVARKVLIVDYRNAKGEISRNRRIAPQQLQKIQNAIYLHAYCFRRQKVLCFALDRFERVECTDEEFKQDWEFSPETTSTAMGVFAVNEVEEVELEFDPILRGYFELHPLHPSQQIFQDDDQSVMRLMVGINETLLHQLTGFGKRIRVISPDHLAAMVMSRHAEALQIEVPEPPMCAEA